MHDGIGAGHGYCLGYIWQVRHERRLHRRGYNQPELFISNYALDVDDVQYYVDYGLKETFYLPGGEPDPLSGDASILDAILVTFMENGYYGITAGWDDVNIPNGGFISEVCPQALSYSVSNYEGENGNTWGHATGTGWNIAYTQGGIIQEATVYGSNIELTAGMEIVFDVSPFDMVWDTGEPW